MHTGFLLETYKVIKIGYPHFVMFAPLIILVSVVLAVEGRDWAGESDGVKVGVEGTLGRISPYEELARKKSHIAVRRKRKKEKKKQRTNCKKKPLQIKCINKKFSKRLKMMEGKMKKYANKGKLGKVEKLLSSRMDKISENLTKNTKSISSSKTKLEEAVNSLAMLQSNMSSLWLGGAEGATGNVSANGSTILEQLNTTRYYFVIILSFYTFIIRSELVRIRESQMAISALVETQGQLLVEQMARLDQIEEKLNTTTANSNITVAQNISSSSNSSLLIQNNTIAASATTAAVSNSNSTAGFSDASANQVASTLGNTPS